MNFDLFMINKWGSKEIAVEEYVKKTGDKDFAVDKEVREEAYKNFYSKAKDAGIANRQTMRRWFGLGDTSVPGRNTVLDMALKFGFSPEEANEYLQLGIMEHKLRITDYMEALIWYCLLHGLDSQKYDKMVFFFESHCDFSIKPKHIGKTQELLDGFDKVKDDTEEAFLTWMLKNRENFKGYSMTAYNIYMNLVDEALEIFRDSTKGILKSVLDDTGFYKWQVSNHADNDSTDANIAEEIRRFLKNESRRKNAPFSEEKKKEIQQLVQVVYGSRGKMNEYLSELYMPLLRGRGKHIDKKAEQGFHMTDAKYISELINMAKHKEKLMNIRMQISKEKGKPDAKIVSKYRSQLQRTHDIRRDDLLIPIQYICTHRYINRININNLEYSQKEARERFIDFADDVLETCGMLPVDDGYYLDHILLSCYKKDDADTFAEMMGE